MNKESFDVPKREHRRRIGLCVVAILTVMTARPGLAQDLKPVSSSLAARIEASGRKTVAVIDFTDLQGNVTELGRFLAEELSVALVGDAKGFKVIDRTHLKAILQEHKLATTGLIDPQTARQLGQIAGVDTLVTGTITAFGDNVRLSAKALDTTTAEMIAASTVDVPKTKAIEELLARGIEGTQPASGATSATAPTSTSGSKPVPLMPSSIPSKLSPAPTSTSGNKPAKPISVQGKDLLFMVKACRRSGGTVSCEGSITNKAEQRVQAVVYWGSSYPGYSYMIDDLGNQYQLAKFVFAGNWLELEPELPINFSLAVDGVKPAASVANLILSTEDGRITLRSIPIQ